MADRTNDPTTRYLVPEDQQVALATNAKDRARHGLFVAFLAEHPAEPYRSGVGFSKLQVSSLTRSFFYASQHEESIDYPTNRLDMTVA